MDSKSDIHQILKSYWGFDDFRPLQEDIIRAAIAGEDALALLPTGGGKSLCFQVPIMSMEGLGIVISPLIALMEDQVERLKQMDIKAIALNSNLSFKEFDRALDNAVNGYYKFLYVSPERLQNEMFLERIKKMKVNLIAVDEAHCISQWGYDFRPSYLEIGNLRNILPQVAVLALTATATLKVVEDIQDKLQFAQKKVFRKSFFRPNLFYNVSKTEKKWEKAVEIFKRIKGSSIIYTRNRKGTVEISKWLIQQGFSADFYHAGLTNAIRKRKQQDWVEDRTRIMVCTNAFGMGIDKPNVRLVLHLELPDSLEAYFQEAGRAGRDGEKAYAVCLIDPSDIDKLRHRYLDSFPDLNFIRKTYKALANFLQLAQGSGENLAFPFSFQEFSKQYSLPPFKLYQAFTIMEREGLIRLDEEGVYHSSVLLKVNRDMLYDFQLRNPSLDPLIKTLVRSYGGLQTEYVKINEFLLAERLQLPVEKVKDQLKLLRSREIIDYLPRKEGSKLHYLQARQKSDSLKISNENMRDRYRELKKRVEKVMAFAAQDEICRSRFILQYFGEEGSRNCGYCDVCRGKKQTFESGEFESLQRKVISALVDGEKDVGSLIEDCKSSEGNLIAVLQWLLEEGRIQNNGKYFTIKK